MYKYTIYIKEHNIQTQDKEKVSMYIYMHYTYTWNMQEQYGFRPYPRCSSLFVLLHVIVHTLSIVYVSAFLDTNVYTLPYIYIYTHTLQLHGKSLTDKGKATQQHNREVNHNLVFSQEKLVASVPQVGLKPTTHAFYYSISPIALSEDLLVILPYHVPRPLI